MHLKIWAYYNSFMDLISLIVSKPVLIGLHLGAAIIGIDAFLWLLGEVIAGAGSGRRRIIAAYVGISGFALAWIIGGYYYVTYYGPLVKPVIKAGNAPWAHGIAMEAKEHVFLFAIPLAVTILLLARVGENELKSLKLRKGMIGLIAILVGLGFSVGAFGFIISAAARWGIIF